MKNIQSNNRLYFLYKATVYLRSYAAYVNIMKQAQC